MQTIYRLLSPTAILGYGFPDASFQAAMEQKIDLIAVDAGSVDAGPYYLGRGKHYVATAALRRDLIRMIRGALEQRCPCIVGSAGFSGADPQFRDIVDLVAEIIEQEAERPVRLAAIEAGIDPATLNANLDVLTPLGRMPALDADIVKASKLVGQMGVEPVITALDAGAEVIVCGRAYDPAVFAADPIRKGFDPGIAYHASKILECGAIACTPGSGSDCLMAELHNDGHAEFYALSAERRTTAASIAAHSLYEKTRPDVFHLPGGTLTLQDTEFFQVDERRAGIRGSRFVSSAPSIKVEGSRCIGQRRISIVPLVDADGISETIAVYGRNGVEARPAADEMGLVVMVTADDAHAARNILATLRSTLLHYGYPGRVSTAGNLAFPCSPNDIDTLIAGRPVSFFIAGSRDPIFRAHWPLIWKTVIAQLRRQLPDLVARCQVTHMIADAENPIAYIETIDDDAGHAEKLAAVANRKSEALPGMENIAIGDVCAWSVHHLLHKQSFLDELFPVQLQTWRDGQWTDSERKQCDWTRHVQASGPLPDETRSFTPNVPLKDKSQSLALIDIADVIRSKNAGINELTYDILFARERHYRQALDSGVFTVANMAEVLDLPEETFVGCFYFNVARAIKVTVHRSCPAGNPGDRDVFGAQQHSRIMGLQIPV